MAKPTSFVIVRAGTNQPTTWKAIHDAPPPPRWMMQVNGVATTAELQSALYTPGQTVARPHNDPARVEAYRKLAAKYGIKEVL